MMKNAILVTGSLLTSSYAGPRSFSCRYSIQNKPIFVWFDAGSSGSRGRIVGNDLGKMERRCKGGGVGVGWGLIERGIKAGAGANHQRLIILSNLCRSSRVSSLKRPHSIRVISR